jgi:hypothetical protein
MMGKDEPLIHTLSVISFVLKIKMSCLEWQDTQGHDFGKSGFLLVHITSLKKLYIIKIR